MIASFVALQGADSLGTSAAFTPVLENNTIKNKYNRFFHFSLTWATFKVPIEPVTTLFLFYALTFQPQGMRDPSSPTKD